MARPGLKAEFFVNANGVITQKAKVISSLLRTAIFERDNYFCQSCDCKVKYYGNTVSPYDNFSPGAIDHIFPRARGGQNNLDNLQLLCITCNAQKGAI